MKKTCYASEDPIRKMKWLRYNRRREAILSLNQRLFQHLTDAPGKFCAFIHAKASLMLGTTIIAMQFRNV